MNYWLNRNLTFLVGAIALVLAAVFPAPLSAGPEPDLSLCSFPGLILPPEAKIYAAGGHKGEPLGWSLEGAQKDSTYVKVAVNSPEAPVVLMLGAYEPNVWQIGWTEGTEILAVMATGYHTQKISGLEPGVPVLISTFQDKNPCGYFSLDQTLRKIMAVNDFAKALFGRDLEAAVPVVKGQVSLGRPLLAGQKILTAQNLSRESPAGAEAPLDGSAGLDEALTKGLIRPATATEHHLWRRASSQTAKNRRNGGYAKGINTREGSDYPQQMVRLPNRSVVFVYEAYMVMSPDFIIPGGLHTDPVITFLLPAGQREPQRSGRSNCEVVARD